MRREAHRTTGTDTLDCAVRSEAERSSDGIVGVRRHLYTHPELAFQDIEMAGLVSRRCASTRGSAEPACSPISTAVALAERCSYGATWDALTIYQIVEGARGYTAIVKRLTAGGMMEEVGQ